MPHIIIEYSDNIDARAVQEGLIEGLVDGLVDGASGGAQWLVDAVHDAALTSPIVPAEALRTRAGPRSLYRVADGDPSNAFVSVVARLGPGRSSEEKTEFLELLLDTAERAVSAAAPGLAVAYSVEFQEIDAEMRINRNHVRTSMHERGAGS